MSSRSSGYIPAIDGLRALAVVAVIVFHVDAAWLPGGFAGVDLFFVISGFVISQSLAARGRQPLGPFLLDFYRRRVQRLMPALLLVLMVTFIVSALLLPRTWRTELYDHTGIAAIFGLANLVLASEGDDYFSPGADLNPFLHMWTLGVEEQFYLLFPLLFFAWLHRARLGWWARGLLPVLFLASLLFAAWQTGAAPTSAFFLLPARLWELAAGALLFQFIATHRPAAFWQHWAAPGLALLLVSFAFASKDAFPFPGALLTVAGSLLVLAAAAVPAADTQRAGTGRKDAFALQLLRWGPLRYLGRLSYALYLWHWPLLVLLRWTYGVQGIALWLYPLLLLALACLTHHLVELPLRRAHARRQAATILCGALLVAGSSAGIAYAISSHADALSLSTTRDGATWRSQRYPAWKSLETLPPTSLEGRKLFVLGDSHAAAYRTMTSMAARKLGMELVIEERGGCPLASLLAPPPASCADDGKQALQRVLERGQPGDVVLLASLRMPELRGQDWQAGDAAVFARIARQRNRQAEADALDEADGIIARLRAKQLHVVIDAPMPIFKAAAYRCSDPFNRMNPACAPGLEVEREYLLAMRAPQMGALETLAARHPGLTVWDPFPILCPAQRCSAMQGVDPLFFDQDHLSGHGNRVLLPSFLATLQALQTLPELPALPASIGD